MKQPDPIDISDEFSKEDIKHYDLKVGKLLRFNMEGSITELIITKLNKKSGKVFAKETKTYTAEEIEAIEDARKGVK